MDQTRLDTSATSLQWSEETRNDILIQISLGVGEILIDIAKGLFLFEQ